MQEGGGIPLSGDLSVDRNGILRGTEDATQLINTRGFVGVTIGNHDR